MQEEYTLDYEPEQIEALDSEPVKIEIWAKLNSLSKRVDSRMITSTTFTMGRAQDNDLIVAD